MSIRLRVGQTLRLPSRNEVVVVALVGADAVCVYAPGSDTRGEIVFAADWLRRFAVVLV